MVSLDNLKTALSAIKSEIKAETNSIKSEINRIATRYLKKTDANKIYITKDSANKSFATKSSVTEIRYFSESQDTLTKIDELRFPYFSRKANRFLGTVEYNPLQSDLGNLRVAGVDNIGFVFNLPENGEADTAYLSDIGIISLIPGLSQSGLFARSDLDLRNAKKVALSNTKDEYSTLTKNQGTMYYNVRVIDKQDDSRSLSFKLSASSNPNSHRLQGMTYGKDGALYYFVSDEIYSNSTVDIPFTLTRIDRYEKLPNPNNLHIFYHGRDRTTSEDEILYDGTQASALHIYRDAVNVNLSQQGNLYYSDLAYSVIGIQRDSGAFVFAKFSYGGLNYSLPLVHIDPDTRRCVFIGLVNKSDYDATFMMFIGDADIPSAKLQGTIETYTVRTAAAQDTIDSGKQDRLIAGKNITIASDGKTISATGGGAETLFVTITDNNGTLSANKSYSEINGAILAGTPVFVNYGDILLPFIAGNAEFLFFGETMVDDTKAVSAIIRITSNDEVSDISAALKTLPNPNAITFTGAVTGSYDGSAPLSVNIPAEVTPLTGTIDEITPSQVIEAVLAGRPVFVSSEFRTYSAFNAYYLGVYSSFINKNGDIYWLVADIDNDTWIEGSALVPTKTSQLTNDSGYLTLATLPIYNGEVQ